MKEKAEQILSIKEELKTALNNKGIEVGDKFSEYPTKVDEAVIDTDPYEVLGYDSTLYDKLKADIAASAGLKLTTTDGTYKITNNSTMVYAPMQDISKGLGINFMNCTNLKYIPNYNIKITQGFDYAFYKTSLEEFPEWILPINTLGIQYSFAYSNIKSVPNFVNMPLVTDASYTFSNCKYLTTVGNVTLENCIKAPGMFMDCVNLNTIGSISLPKATDISYMFSRCYSLTKFSSINAPNATSVSGLFEDTNIRELPNLSFPAATDIMDVIPLSAYTVKDIDISSVKYLEYALTNRHRVTSMGSITIPSVISASYFQSTTLNTCTFKELGTSSSCTSLDFSPLTAWGTGTGTSAQSVYDSIVTYSYDRAAAGYSACTVVLSTNTYNAVAARYSSFAQEASAKGYTITVSE
jgi:hypothetical protein